MIRETIIKEMQAQKEKPSELAKAIGSHTAPIYNYLNGKAGLSYNILEKICEHYDFVLIKKF